MESRAKWRKRSQRTKPLLYLSIIAFFFVLLVIVAAFISSYAELLRSILPIPTGISETLAKAQSLPPQCGPRGDLETLGLAGERFLWYAPHSGFSNQVSELKNALVFSAILNRTLIVPPVLDHHAVSLGSCPKFRVAVPSELRAKVWDHVMELVRDRRYVSMADIVDLPSIGSSLFKTIDFRLFASKWCGLDMDGSCYGSLCCSVTKLGSFQGRSHECRSLVSGLQSQIDGCVYAVEEDCRTTVWTYQQSDDGILDQFQPDKELLKKKKISYVRRRRDVYRAFGPNSQAEKATVLAFGSLFSSPYKGSKLYIDIHEAPRDARIQSLMQKIEFLPFTQEIMRSGKEFALKNIKAPFLCAQLRLLDGQFKNHWKVTFSALKQKIQSLEMELKGDKVGGPIHIFIMTDLPITNWTGTYLADLANNLNSYKLHTLQESDNLIVQTAKDLMTAEHGLRSGLLPLNHDQIVNNRVCNSALLPEVLLYVEETVCSCASLGFVGTAGSTIADSIYMMRKNNICARLPPSNL